MPFFITIFFPALVGVLLQTIVMKLVALAFRIRAITWSHCAVFAFFVTSAVVFVRFLDSHWQQDFNLPLAIVLSLLLYSSIGVAMFSRLPRGDKATVGVTRAALMPLLSVSIATSLLLGVAYGLNLID